MNTRIITIQVQIADTMNENEHHSFVLLDSFIEATQKNIYKNTGVLFTSARIIKSIDSPIDGLI